MITSVRMTRLKDDRKGCKTLAPVSITIMERTCQKAIASGDDV